METSASQSQLCLRYEFQELKTEHLLTRPQIGEVARAVHHLRKHLVNRTIKSVQASEDEIVYGKVGTSAAAFKTALTGKKVLAAKQQGKYFYLEMSSPPHPLMHFGMTGWLHVKGEETVYYKQAKEKEAVEQEWPPRFMKFILETEDGEEIAFVDARRLARIRLVQCEAAEMRNTSPLKENGPDPVIDKDVLTVEWLSNLMRRKKVPIKALLLDQGNISGVGNWVADEVLYQAKIHPEQYCNTFSVEQTKTLHDSLTGVCTFAVECLADSKKFPEHWLMKYRWDKGKKDSNTLPNGEKIVHLKVGGRTSAIVPSVQKKTAAVAGDVENEVLDDGEDEEDKKKPKRGSKRKSKAAAAEEDESEEEVMPVKKTRGKKAETEPEEKAVDEAKPARKSRGKKAKEVAPETNEMVGDEEDAQANGGADEDEDEDEKPAKAKGRVKAAPKKAAAGKSKATKTKVAEAAIPGERKSARNAAK